MKILRYLSTFLLASTLCLHASDTYSVNSSQVVDPAYPADPTPTPIITGNNLKKSQPITHMGLYRDFSPAKLTNLGQELPDLNNNNAMGLGNQGIYFIRPINNLYTNKNIVWKGEVSVNGKVGSLEATTDIDQQIPNAGYHIEIDPIGRPFRIYTSNTERRFLLAFPQGYGARWTDLAARTKSGSFERKLYIHEQVQLPATIYGGLHAHNSASNSTQTIFKLNSAEIKVNNVGNNNHRFSFNVTDPTHITQGENTFTFSTWGSSNVFLDYLQIYFPVDETNLQFGFPLEDIQTGNSDYDKLSNYWESRTVSELRIKNTFSGTKTLTIPGATYAVDYTTFGQEQLIPVADAGTSSAQVTLTPEMTSVYVTNKSAFPNLSYEMDNSGQSEVQYNLSLQEISGYNYIAISPKHIIRGLKNSSGNYTMPPMTKYSELVNYHKANGLKPIPSPIVFEDIMNTYGCGIYGVNSLFNFVDSHENTIDYLFFIGGSSDDHKLQIDRAGYTNNNWTDIPDQKSDIAQFYLKNDKSLTPGIPGVFLHSPDTDISMIDDPFSAANFMERLNSGAQPRELFKIQVGRLPIWNATEFDAWVQRLVNYSPSDTAMYLAGSERGAQFHNYQMEKETIFPGQFVLHLPSPENNTDGHESDDYMNQTVDNEATSSLTTYHKFNRQMRNTMHTNDSNLVVYQGHGNTASLDDKSLIHAEFSEHMESLPPSSWILATCQGGNYGYNLYLYRGNCLTLNMFRGTTSNFAGFPSSTRGAISIIGSSALGLASRENEMVHRMMQKINESPQATWGEILHYAKKNIFYDTTMKHYFLLGDPAVRVMPNAPRRVVYDSANSAFNQITINLTGNWENQEVPVTDLTLEYSPDSTGTAESHVQWTPLKTESILLRNQWGSVIGIKDSITWDISTLSFSNTYQFRVVSEKSLQTDPNLPSSGFADYTHGNSGKTKTTWLKFTTSTPSFYVNVTSPTPGTADGNSIACEANASSIGNLDVLYRFYLETKDPFGNEVIYESPMIRPLTNTTPKFEYTQTNYAILSGEQFRLYCRAYLPNGNYAQSAGVDFTWEKTNLYENGLNLSGPNGIVSDNDLIKYYGRLDFYDGNLVQDSDQDGVTDYEELLAGTHPYEFNLSLTQGWNLISLPFKPNDQTMNTLDLATTGEQLVWYKDRYISVLGLNGHPKPNALQAFWVYALNDTIEPLKVSGTAPTSYDVTINEGWNLVGMGRKELVHPIDEKLTPAYSWIESQATPGKLIYEKQPEGNPLEILTGYWFYNQDLKRTINLDQE